MATEAMRQAAYEIERRYDTIAEMRSVLDDPELPTYYDGIHAEAEYAVEAESLGMVETHTWLIIPFHSTGGWGYRAEALDAVPHGCVHTGSGATGVLAMAQAIEEHRAGTACRDVR